MSKLLTILTVAVFAISFAVILGRAVAGDATFNGATLLCIIAMLGSAVVGVTALEHKAKGRR